jgi:N-acetyl-anhydromuramyl-L-alanine amidase AmpD
VTHPTAPFRKNWGELTEPRIGVMVHFDASTTDEGAIKWFTMEGCKVSYNFMVMDSGNIIPIAPADKRAWHAGPCKSPDKRLVYRDANSAFYGISIAATVGDVATVEQKRSVTALCLSLFQDHGWPISDTWRIVSHRQHAVFPKGHPKAGQYGRKSDPEGPDLAHPVMNTNEIRGMVSARQVAA